MKTIFCVRYAFYAFAALVMQGAEPAKPFPLVELSDGRVLRNVTLANPTRSTILLRPAGGAAVLLRYEFLPSGVREAAEAMRPGGPLTKGEAPPKPVELRGQLFITTNGAGAYKFSAVTVYAFPAELFSAGENTRTTVDLPAPLARATTDGDGRFTIKVPGGPAFFIFAQASRLVGGYMEKHQWRVAASQAVEGELLLDGKNDEAPWKVKIEGEK